MSQKFTLKDTKGSGKWGRSQTVPEVYPQRRQSKAPQEVGKEQKKKKKKKKKKKIFFFFFLLLFDPAPRMPVPLTYIQCHHSHARLFQKSTLKGCSLSHQGSREEKSKFFSVFLIQLPGCKCQSHGYPRQPWHCPWISINIQIVPVCSSPPWTVAIVPVP